MSSKPLILVVNDDGYEAKGLQAMVEIAKSLGEVVVVVPDRAQSAMSHAITINTPLRLNLYQTIDGVSYWRTNGTPTDCMKLGEKVVLKGRKIDLVLSGINHGSNSSASVIYSGTLAAAIEASFNNIPAIGLSLQDFSANADFTACIHHGKIIIKNILEKGMPSYTSLNINVPKIPIEDIKGVKIVRQAKGRWCEEMEERIDTMGKKYYWPIGHFENTDLKEDTCEWALQHNYISVQPIQVDMTAYEAINNLKHLEYDIER